MLDSIVKLLSPAEVIKDLLKYILQNVILL